MDDFKGKCGGRQLPNGDYTSHWIGRGLSRDESLERKEEKNRKNMSGPDVNCGSIVEK